MSKSWWDGLILAAAAALLLAALALPMACALAEELSPEEERLIEAWHSGELIRLHVIANSDSAYDQAIKLSVRDAVIDAFGELLAEAGEESSEAVYALLAQNAEAMRQTAQLRARELGFAGKVSVETGVMHLPAKSYGQVTLPEGEYKALRIVLGEGKGENWWCVLFPQLCLALAQDDGDAVPQWQTKRIFRQWLIWKPLQGCTQSRKVCYNGHISDGRCALFVF